MSKITIIGSGNIGFSLAKGLLGAGHYQPNEITITRRSIAALQATNQEGFTISNDNAKAIQGSEVIVLCVLPQQVNGVMQEIAPVLKEHQLIVSVVSGLSCESIRKVLGEECIAIRAMPNTAISIGQSMTCIASDNASAEHLKVVEDLFATVGTTIVIEEELMTSATALCACGSAFFLRAVRAASQGGVEIGFHADDALIMAIQTANGAVDLLLKNQSHPENEIDKVTSPKGCTIAGLNEMEHNGFSSAFIKGIKLSALKADGLYEE